MIWEVFRQPSPDEPHEYAGHVHAPDSETAVLFAQVQHSRRKPTHSLWVVPKSEITKVTADEAEFGGTVDKSYRWVQSFKDVGPPSDDEAEEATIDPQQGEG